MIGEASCFEYFCLILLVGGAVSGIFMEFRRAGRK